MIFLRKLHYWIKDTTFSVLNFFHKRFFQFIPLQTFMYGCCGGAVAGFNIFVYFIAYNFVLKKELVQITDQLAISAHIGAFIIAFLITFPIGFYLNMFVVFPEANRRRRIHLLRYFIVVLMCIFLNYIFIKLFVEYFGLYPTPSALLTTIIVTLVSYVLQRFFSFKKKRESF